MRSWTPASPSAPRLRLAGFHDDDEGDLENGLGEEPSFPSPPEDESAGDHPSELLTSEEIAMLLDDSTGGSDREENKA